MQRERYRIADLIVDVDVVSVTRWNGETILLPRLSFDLLVALARRAPAVISADELIATVWNGTAVSDETLTQRVALLRKALGDEAKSPRYLRAVRGRGYQLVPEVIALPAVEERPRSRQWIVPVAAVVALLAIGFGLFFALSYYGRSRIRSTEETVASTRAPSVPELLSRAGSYLRQHQESDNELAIELYRRVLQMEPENPVAMAGLSLALAQRATKFNRNGGEREQAVVLAQKALALEPRLGLAHHALGLALDSKGQVTPAITAYLRAAELEPDPTSALASAAYLMQVQGKLADALEANLHVLRERGDSSRDSPNYLEVQIAMILALLDFDEAAEIWFERAIALRPDNVFAASSYAQMRLSQGRLREADEIAARALGRGIRRPELPAIRGVVALMQGDEPRAEAFFKKALTIDSQFVRARTRLLLLARRQPGGASAVLERRYRQDIQNLRQSRAGGDEWPDGAIDEMLLEAGFGDQEAALRALDTAIDLGWRDDDWLLLDPMLAGLRANPEFKPRIETIRRLVAAERQRVLRAGWLPPALLDGSAARM
jgi:DNA-binding winged helix-turn-helix (wHTH) protein/tetratricopeptide (TPR) repeat protein